VIVAGKAILRACLASVKTLISGNSIYCRDHKNTMRCVDSGAKHAPGEVKEKRTGKKWPDRRGGKINGERSHQIH